MAGPRCVVQLYIECRLTHMHGMSSQRRNLIDRDLLSKSDPMWLTLSYLTPLTPQRRPAARQVWPMD
jgi:hypothetical protein